ncbi:MAG: CDP-glycerol glycerophosphotransferase family protein [Ruminococcus sp.]|nr:CDP-glycerol glycerophosphotransferase family protein [Ruminococcus sp.]
MDPKSFKYFRLLAEAGYLITDTSFTTKYIKKKGQVILNTWHGTPLKVMGRDVADSAYSMGNIERNLLFSDYLVYPNEYMKEKMVSAYMLEGVYKGTILNEGYPRNCIFFDKLKARDVRTALGLDGKKVYVYMPTWRGNLAKMKTDEQMKLMQKYLSELDGMLDDDEVIITKLHPFMAADLDTSGFRHIIPMDPEYDSYEVLSAADGLITDYSSVFYDFANTGKKIILFAYDEEAYMAERGVYVSLDELPFPKVRDAESLVREMRSPKNYDDTEFLRYNCTYESPGAGERILRHVIGGEKVCNEERIYDSSKENVLIFAGSLAKNGITTACLNLLSQLDLDRYRYYVTFQQPMVADDPMRVSKIPAGARIIPMSTKPNYTLGEALAMIRFYKLDRKGSYKKIERMCRRDAERFFGGIDFRHVVQYEGYGKNMIHLFRAFDCDRTIFVHNNMLEELATKNNQHRLSLVSAYRDYDKVACVTQDLVGSTRELAGDEARITVVNNCHDYRSVLERADAEMKFDETTLSTVPAEELKEILGDRSLMKIINIGRFSAEKGHDLLTAAFEKFASVHPEARLIIIGGYGSLYNDTLAAVKRSPAADKIIVIRAVYNPMPILRQCDLFVLSSRYEGLGLTILEADTLGIPVVSTEICGPSGFMREHGGYMVPCSAEGILEGMNAFAEGKVRAMNVDYEAYNKNAAAQFEGLLK